MANPIKLFENSIYKKKAPLMQTIQDLRDGDHEVLIQSKYLWPHEFEVSPSGYQLRAIREKRSRYTNCMELVESTWVSLVLKHAMAIPQEVVDLFGDGINDVDGDGKDIKTFLREVVAPLYFRLGNPHILTNAPAEGAVSRGEESALGIKPFWQAISPLAIKDWQVDKSIPSIKRYKAIRWEYTAEQERDGLESAPVDALYSQSFRLKDGKVYDKRYRSEGERASNLWVLEREAELQGWQELPIAFIESETWLKEVSEQQLKLFNLESALDSQLNSQAFQRIFITGVTSEKAKVMLHEYVINFLPEGSAVTIAEPTNPVALQDRIAQTGSLLFRVAFNRAFTLNEASKESVGADSAAAMREEQTALVLNAIDDLELLINRAIQHYAKFKNAKNFKGKVVLSRDVDEMDLDKTIQLAQSVYDEMKKSPTWIREYLKAVADEMPVANKETIKQEIDGASFSSSAPIDIRSAIKERLSGTNKAVPS